jgi:hypothetical protein
MAYGCDLSPLEDHYPYLPANGLNLPNGTHISYCNPQRAACLATFFCLFKIERKEDYLDNFLQTNMKYLGGYLGVGCILYVNLLRKFLCENVI